MSSDTDVSEEEDTVRYGDNEELAFHREERAST